MDHSLNYIAPSDVVEPVIEKQTGAEVDLAGDSVKIVTKDGRKLEVGKEASLPDNFPKDVPAIQICGDRGLGSGRRGCGQY